MSEVALRRTQLALACVHRRQVGSGPAEEAFEIVMDDVADDAMSVMEDKGEVADNVSLPDAPSSSAMPDLSPCKNISWEYRQERAHAG